MFLAYDTFKLIFPGRKDKTAWLGETEDRKIGFFKSEHVQEQFNYDSLDGKYNKIRTFFPKISFIGSNTNNVSWLSYKYICEFSADL